MVSTNQNLGPDPESRFLALAEEEVGRARFFRSAGEEIFRTTGADGMEIRITDGDHWWGIRRDDGGWHEPVCQPARPGGANHLPGHLPAPPGEGILDRLVDDLFRSRFDPVSRYQFRIPRRWIADTSRPITLASDLGSLATSSLRTEAGFGALLLMPLRFRGGEAGLVLLGFDDPRPGRYPDLDEAEALAAAFARAETIRRIQHALRERRKELDGLHDTRVLLESIDRPLRETLRRLAERLPAAFQFPSLASCRIRLGEVEARFHSRSVSTARLRSTVRADGVDAGFVEIAYSDDFRWEEAVPFLPEEREFLDNIASLLARRLESDRWREEQEHLARHTLHADRLATLGMLSAGIAHELNEPLAGILGFAQLARKTIADDAPVASDLDRIVRAALHARDIVRKLLLFSRQAPARPRRIDLQAVTDEALGMITSGHLGDAITLCRHAPGPPPFVFGDPAQLRQVVVNLVVNALQAMPDGGTLTVSTTIEGTEAVLEVGDTGVGMTPEVLSQVFLPFFTTKDVGEGTGLGLSTVHGIVRAHGGRIEVDSQPGCGARFTVRFPTAPTEGEESHDP